MLLIEELRNFFWPTRPMISTFCEPFDHFL
jgi:hypothetical protein